MPSTPAPKHERQARSSRPLAGKRVLVGRAPSQARELSQALRRLGATVAEIPFLEIRKPASFAPLDAALRRLAQYDWLILTSVNGVSALFERMGVIGVEADSLRRLQIAAIGPATRRAIERRGAKVAVMPREYVAESVVSELKPQIAGKRVILVRAKVARDVIPRELRQAGATVEVVDAYETVVPETSRTELTQTLQSPRRKPHVIPFTSSSAARNFVELAGAQIAYSGVLDNVALASIGPVTSTTMRELNLQVSVEARNYTIPGLVDAIARHFQQ